MKRLISILLVLAMLPALTSCASVYSNYREMEELLVIRTMGLDAAEAGIVLSLASGADNERGKAPVRLRVTGASIASAFERAQNYSFEESLFFSHISSMLVGEDAAKRGVGEYVNYICQAPRIRMDIPIYIIKGSTAESLMAQTGDDDNGIAEILSGVREYLDDRGATAYSVSDLARETLRHGSALVGTLEYAPSIQQSTDDDDTSGGSNGNGNGSTNGTTPRATAAAAGYAVMQNMKLAAFIDLEDALGVDFIKNTVRVSDIVVPGRGGETVTLEITDGGCDIVPRWASDGTLTRMDFRAHVSATVLEAGGRADLDSVDYAAYLTEQLEDYVTEKISRVLSLSAKLGSDFLALGSAAELDDPALYRLLPMQFDSYLGELEMRVAVKGQISHSNDIRRSVQQVVST